MNQVVGDLDATLHRDLAHLFDKQKNIEHEREAQRSREHAADRAAKREVVERQASPRRAWSPPSVFLGVCIGIAAAFTGSGLWRTD